MKNAAYSIAGIATILVVGYFWLNNYLYTSPQIQETVERTALSGVYLCLPLKDQALMDTDCAVGIKADDGNYYAIDLGLMAGSAPLLIEGDILTASGIITPIDNLSTDYWQKYAVTGIFSVTDSLVITGRETQEQIATSTTLTSNAWVWERTLLQNEEERVAPLGKFVLVFSPDKTYTSSTDCNMLAGSYTADGATLSVQSPIATKMFCRDSLESEYIQELLLVDSYVIEGNTLRLSLDRGYGKMLFTMQ